MAEASKVDRFQRQEKDGRIWSVDKQCKSRSMRYPDNESGRANLAEWESRHTCKAGR